MEQDGVQVLRTRRCSINKRLAEQSAAKTEDAKIRIPAHRINRDRITVELNDFSETSPLPPGPLLVRLSDVVAVSHRPLRQLFKGPALYGDRNRQQFTLNPLIDPDQDLTTVDELQKLVGSAFELTRSRSKS